MTDVRIDEKGTIWVGRGAVMLYGPFTEDERDSLRRRILMAFKYEHVPDAPPPSTAETRRISKSPSACRRTRTTFRRLRNSAPAG